MGLVVSEIELHVPRYQLLKALSDDWCECYESLAIEVGHSWFLGHCVDSGGSDADRNHCCAQRCVENVCRNICQLVSILPGMFSDLWVTFTKRLPNISSGQMPNLVIRGRGGFPHRFFVLCLRACTEFQPIWHKGIMAASLKCWLVVHNGLYSMPHVLCVFWVHGMTVDFFA